MRRQACFFCFMIVLLMGCSEAPSIGSIHFHSPGKYTGKVDPLLTVAGTPKHEARLRARFQQIQTDR
jgi:hypothetical protein